MKKTIADVLRKEIGKSGLSARELGETVGLPWATITEFIRGRDMRLSRAQKLADYFGLELQPKARRRRK